MGQKLISRAASASKRLRRNTFRRHKIFFGPGNCLVHKIPPVYVPTKAFVLLVVPAPSAIAVTTGDGEHRGKRTPTIESEVITLSPVIDLEFAEWYVEDITCIPEHDLVALIAYSKKVYIYSYETKGEPLHVFGKHANRVSALVHLSGDLLASVDHSGVLVTWRAGTCTVLDKLQVSEDMNWEITKASSTHLLVGTSGGEIISVRHDNGQNLAVENRVKDNRLKWMGEMDACNDICAVVLYKNGLILNHSTGNILHDFKDNKNERINAVAVSENLIVTGGEDGQIYVREIGDGYELLRTVNLRDFYNCEFRLLDIADLTFLSADIVMVGTYNAGLFFVSVESGICMSHFKLQPSNVMLRAAVLSDGRIFVGGSFRNSFIFQPPPEVADCISYSINSNKNNINSLHS